MDAAELREQADTVAEQQAEALKEKAGGREAHTRSKPQFLCSRVCRVSGGEVQADVVNHIQHYRESPLVQKAISDIKTLLEKRQASKELEERSNTRQSVREALKNRKKAQEQQSNQEQAKTEEGKEERRNGTVSKVHFDENELMIMAMFEQDTAENTKRNWKRFFLMLQMIWQSGCWWSR